MKKHSTDGVRAALPPIASLISKSEKAQQKLKPGTWQHTRLRDNLKALHIAVTLMDPDTGKPHRFPRAELQAAVQALAALIGTSEKSLAKFTPGMSAHTLQHNRLKALRIAAALVGAELNKSNP